MKGLLTILQSFLLVGVVFSLTSCGGGSAPSQGKGSDAIERPKVAIDLPAIKKRGKLVAITGYSSTSYFLYRGEPMGYEYELLKRLAEHLEVELDVKIARNMDDLFRMLNTGKGDIIAYGMTITQERKQKVAFTEHHNIVNQVLVQKKPDNWRRMKLHEIDEQLVRSPVELIGEEVAVRENSSYFHRLQNLAEEIGGVIPIDTVPGNVSTGELIRRVAQGEVEFTVADKNIALVNQTYYPNIDIETEVSFPQRIAWAVRKNSPELLQAVNSWIRNMRKETDYYVIYNKYFKNRKQQGRRVESDYYSPKSGKVSPFDAHFREVGEEIGIDWRLLAAQCYQESRFDPSANSWAGAKGVMQLMPATAKRFGAKDPSAPEQSIQAAARYLTWLNEAIWSGIEDSTERLKFILASYNVGERHVQDAQRLARKYGKDPEKWDGHVAKFLLKKSRKEYYSDEVVEYGYCRGSEPYAYVQDIFARYEHYKKFTKEEAEQGSAERAAS